MNAAAKPMDAQEMAIVRRDAVAFQYAQAFTGAQILALMDEVVKLRAVIATAGKLHQKDPYDVTGKYCICEQLWPCLDAAALGLTAGQEGEDDE